MNQARLLRRGRWLEYVTFGWNVVGCVVLLAAAISAGSVALAGFGVDSVIEIVASSVVVWQLNGAAVDGRTGQLASTSLLASSATRSCRSRRA